MKANPRGQERYQSARVLGRHVKSVVDLVLHEEGPDLKDLIKAPNIP
jgi:hypothetical protein